MIGTVGIIRFGMVRVRQWLGCGIRVWLGYG